RGTAVARAGAPEIRGRKARVACPQKIWRGSETGGREAEQEQEQEQEVEAAPRQAHCSAACRGGVPARAPGGPRRQGTRRAILGAPACGRGSSTGFYGQRPRGRQHQQSPDGEGGPPDVGAGCSFQASETGGDCTPPQFTAAPATEKLAACALAPATSRTPGQPERLPPLPP
ncbi:unnamed protein product, partial [Prorocentrum cordatum]